MSIVRTWKKAHPDTLWSIWDAGSEFWELKDGNLRHFSVIERYKEGELIIEKVLPLRESSIPLEVVRQTILGWEVSEIEVPEVIRPLELKASQKLVQEWSQGSQLEAPAQVQRPQAQVQRPQVQRPQIPRKSAFLPLTQGPAFLPDNPEDSSTHPQPHSQSQLPASANTPKIGEAGTPFEEHIVQEDVYSQPLNTQEELSSQESYNAPTELWSALSQWIPPNALFQPSLHHQAFLELSGTQEKTYPGKKDSEGNLRQKEAGRPYLSPARNSRPYQPKTFVQQTKGPLFI
jgi:hypothetical protein